MELRTGAGGNRDEIARRLRESLVEVTTTEHQLRAEIERVQAELAKLPPTVAIPAPPESSIPAAPGAAGPGEPADRGQPATGQPDSSPVPPSSAVPTGTDAKEAGPPTPATLEGGAGTLPASAEAAAGTADTAPSATSSTDAGSETPPDSDESALVTGLPRPPTNAGPRAHLETRLADLETQLGDVQAAKESIATQLRNLPATSATAEADANVLAVRQLLAAAGIDDVDREALEPLAELSKLSVDEELAALRREMGLDPLAPPSGPRGAEPPGEDKSPEAKKPAE